ncbi:hypothetical protein CS542_01130 [Pedobacter sp. IW39]|nr:hypothetical protein CS542_01130 [Pedobacter sp. IW39]
MMEGYCVICVNQMLHRYEFEILAPSNNVFMLNNHAAHIVEGKYKIIGQYVLYRRLQKHADRWV